MPYSPATPPSDDLDDDPWRPMRDLTTARIGLGRAGVSVPTRHNLGFQLAHAQARDAVNGALDSSALQLELAATGHETLLLHSTAGDRVTYLRRPDLGRRLDRESVRRLTALRRSRSEHYDAVFIIADGLSALAVQRHAVPLLNSVLALLPSDEWRLAPLAIAQQARVAISDEIGLLLGARQAIIMIGERPGLSSPDSLGIYLTYGPQLGNTDAQRNCISNVRAAGLSYEQAAETLVYLMREARRRRLSGVKLKDGARQLDLQGSHRARLTSNANRNCQA